MTMLRQCREGRRGIYTHYLIPAIVINALTLGPGVYKRVERVEKMAILKISVFVAKNDNNIVEKENGKA